GQVPERGGFPYRATAEKRRRQARHLTSREVPDTPAIVPTPGPQNRIRECASAAHRPWGPGSASIEKAVPPGRRVSYTSRAGPDGGAGGFRVSEGCVVRTTGLAFWHWAGRRSRGML